MSTNLLPGDLLSDVLNILNIALTASILFLLVRQWRRTLPHTSWRVVRFRSALTVISFYWMAIYIYVSMGQPGGPELCAWMGDCSNNWFGSVFIKPALTFTFATMLSITIRNEKIENARQRLLNRPVEDNVPQ